MAKKLFNEGDALVGAQRYPEAVESFRHAVRLDPRIADHHYGLGVALALVNDQPSSAAALRESLRLDPSNQRARELLAKITGTQVESPSPSMTEQILGPQFPTPPPSPTPTVLQRAVESVSDSAKAKRLYAEGLDVFTRRPKDAVRLLGQVVELEPENAEYRNSFGAALANVGLYDQAILEFKEALRLRPGFQKASANLSIATGEIERRQAGEIRRR